MLKQLKSALVVLALASVGCEQEQTTKADPEVEDVDAAVQEVSFAPDHLAKRLQGVAGFTRVKLGPLEEPWENGLKPIYDEDHINFPLDGTVSECDQLQLNFESDQPFAFESAQCSFSARTEEESGANFRRVAELARSYPSVKTTGQKEGDVTIEWSGKGLDEEKAVLLPFARWNSSSGIGIVGVRFGGLCGSRFESRKRKAADARQLKRCSSEMNEAILLLLGLRVETVPLPELDLPVECTTVERCHLLAGQAFFRGERAKAVSIFSELCYRGYADSCKEAASALTKMGRVTTAIGMYERGCDRGDKGACNAARNTEMLAESGRLNSDGTINVAPPRAPEPRAREKKQRRTSGGPIVHGPLAERKVSQVVQDNRGEVRRCFTSHLSDNTDDEAYFVVKFTIAASGKAFSASVKETALKNNPLEKCVTKEIRSWTFPKPKAGGIVYVIYPFKVGDWAK